MLPEFGATQRCRIDNIAAHSGAGPLHRLLHGGEEGSTGVLHQVPAVGDLDRIRPAIGSSLDIPGTTSARDHADRRPRGKPSGYGCRLAVGQEVNDATLLQITDDRA